MKERRREPVLEVYKRLQFLSLNTTFITIKSSLRLPASANIHRTSTETPSLYHHQQLPLQASTAAVHLSSNQKPKTAHHQSIQPNNPIHQSCISHVFSLSFSLSPSASSQSPPPFQKQMLSLKLHVPILFNYKVELANTL
jgi:hypothetical protein